ncbi:MAPEG family protein [Pararhizobium haloflavum]|uniref:MAPEG family protein n=1 Tax=Pararhizobium haloflavum TaxID=2037914 RepID=UPI000C192FB8|nr:MAPEG family protein [Pararhizobium haloflavum]
MGSTAIFWPVIVQVALIYGVYFLASKRRVGAVKRGEVEARAFLVPNVEPEQSATVIRNLINQFELPMLFIFACFGLYMIAAANVVVVILAWLFVASRVVHAYVHVTSNDLRRRRPAFIAGFVLNGLLWLYFAFRLAVA